MSEAENIIYKILLAEECPECGEVVDAWRDECPACGYPMDAEGWRTMIDDRERDGENDNPQF